MTEMTREHRTGFHSSKYYPYLDGWRAVAMIWVLLLHILVLFDTEAVYGRFFPVLNKIASLGMAAVDMFFVLSGFLITGILLDSKGGGPPDIKRFYLRRFFKIVPSYLIAVFSGFAISVALQHETARGFRFFNPKASLVSYLLFIQNYTPNFPPLAHTWTLAVEEHFYLLYPVFLLLTWKLGGRFREKPWFYAVIITALILFLNLQRYLHTLEGDWIARFFNSPKHDQGTIFRADALLFGCLLKFLEPYFTSWRDRTRRFFSYLCLAAGILCYTVLFRSGWNTGIWYHFTLAYLGAGLLFIATYEEGLLKSLILEHPALVWLGKTSYCFYLWHYILIFPFALLAKWYSPLWVWGYVAACVLAGYGTTRFIEGYFLCAPP